MSLRRARARGGMPKGVSESLDSGTICTLADQFPGQTFSRPKRDQCFFPKFQAQGHVPVFLLQCNAVLVARQLVKIRAMEAGKGFQFIQRARLFEDFRIELNSCMRSVDPRAAASSFFDGP